MDHSRSSTTRAPTLVPSTRRQARDGEFLYVQAGASGIVDEYRINGDGSLSQIGSVVVSGAIGGEGIVAV